MQTSYERSQFGTTSVRYNAPRPSPPTPLNKDVYNRRQHYGLDNTFNIGFGTSLGTVTAARKWEEPGYLFNLLPGIPGSFEQLFHSVAEATSTKNFMLFFRSNSKEQDLVNEDVVKYLGKKTRYRISFILLSLSFSTPRLFLFVICFNCVHLPRSDTIDTLASCTSPTHKSCLIVPK